MTVTAVTGEIGSGKSTVSAVLARLMECRLVDADKVAAEIWTRPDVKEAAVSRWGNGILDADGNIIKAEISRRIFADDDSYRFCDSLIHPLVMDEIHGLAGDSDIVAEIPLLPEAGRPSWADRAVYVMAGFSVRAERCRARGWDDDELLRREKFLLPESERIAVCDYVIRNEGSLADLEGQAVKFLQENDR
ncbi:MAG: dephospho-CoA kinase [Synergistaceae bacterium]|nr:dephospho-CoA kinase [Synergistaceae bacterium]